MVCEICEQEFEEKYFDVTQNKCILHSEKDASYENDNFDICLHKYILRFEDKLSIELNEIFSLSSDMFSYTYSSNLHLIN